MRNKQGFILIVFMACIAFGQVHAQRRVSIIGHVYDADSHQPLLGVSIRNINTGIGTLTDTAGAYKMQAGDYDRIVFSYLGYRPDTVQVNALYIRQRIDINLHKNRYSIAPVEIIGQRPNYQRDSMERRYWFSDVLGQEKTHGLGAIEHPISALYDALSGRQKRIWRFQKDYKAYEQQKYIRSRVRPGLIERTFGLSGDSLKAFLLWYDPSYYFVRGATDYDLLADIKQAVIRFRRGWAKKESYFP